MARDVKGNKDFCRHMDSKRKTRENVRRLLNGAKGLETKETEKAKILNALLPLSLPSGMPGPGDSRSVWSKD